MRRLLRFRVPSPASRDVMAEANPQTPRVDVPGLLHRAVAMHQGGRLREAEKLYMQVLAAQPDNFDALHLCGECERR